MSRKRYLSTAISTDPRIRRLAERSEFAALLYTWMIPHAADDATITADPEELLMLVIPGFRWRTAQDVEDALDEMTKLGLVEALDDHTLRFPLASFYRYQQYITESRRTPTLVPPPNGAHPRNSAKSAKPRDSAPESAASSSFKSSSPVKFPAPTPVSSCVPGEVQEGAAPPHTQPETRALKVVPEPVPKPQPKHKPIDDDFIEQLVDQYEPDLGGREHVRLIIDRALNHKAIEKAIDKRRYLQTWLRQERETYQPRTPGRAAVRRSPPPVSYERIEAPLFDQPDDPPGECPDCHLTIRGDGVGHQSGCPRYLRSPRVFLKKPRVAS